MKEIKRLNVSELSEKFGLEAESKSFVFKPQDVAPNKYFEPHRSDMYSLGIVIKGEAKLRVGLETYVVNAPGLVAVSPDQIRQWMVTNENFETISLFYAEDFVVAGLLDTLFVKKLQFLKKGRNSFIPLTNAGFAALKNIFDQIEKKASSNYSNKVESTQALIRVLLLEVEGLQEIRTIKDLNKYSQPYFITQKFKELLAEHFAENRAVSYYAEKLFVTAKHLSQTLKEQTGKTANEMINEIVCLEAKVLLQTEELNISSVSERLNFVNPSFFGKFFKRNTGMSPNQYRKTLS
ncbi:MAG: AraC family transcriptional regulator [Mucilaginibacter sp.]|uniref:AraC family transcriptional regulator n=1 Tax=Mucilaginibacter sp. TaxID=1882438 RepID=UPI0034E5DC1C